MSQWKDWRWHIRHTIQDIETVENLLGIVFPGDTRKRLEETVERFPLRITPYYLSLIQADDDQSDPVFMQAFPPEKELIVERYDMKDPLAKDTDSPRRPVSRTWRLIHSSPKGGPSSSMVR
jgi:lysine 2,3-aminomutase